MRKIYRIGMPLSAGTEILGIFLSFFGKKEGAPVSQLCAELQKAGGHSIGNLVRRTLPQETRFRVVNDGVVIASSSKASYMELRGAAINFCTVERDQLVEALDDLAQQENGGLIRFDSIESDVIPSEMFGLDCSTIEWRRTASIVDELDPAGERDARLQLVEA